MHSLKGSLTLAEAQEQARRDVELYDEDPPAPSLLDDSSATFESMPLAAQPSGMVTRLFDFQRQGLHWMQEREERGKKFGEARGGILADEMGLGERVRAVCVANLNRLGSGKTLQTIGLIMSRPPPPEERQKFRHVSLILAPVSCLQQWADELQMHSPGLRVLIYHGSQARRKPLASLFSYDILLSSYSTVAMGLFKKNGDVNDNDPLFKIRFWRIVLDEGHQIRNVTTRAHKACMLLHATRRWVLTGTPIQNRSSDLCALLRFLRVGDLASEWSRAKKRCEKVDQNVPQDVNWLQGLRRTHMLRRTKRTKINGKPIFDLPEATMVLNDVPFNPEERQLYNAVKQRMGDAFRAWDARGELDKHASSVFGYIMRLRQLCLHPLLFVFGKLRNIKDNNGQYILKSNKTLDVGECMMHYRTVIAYLADGASMTTEGLDAAAVQIVQLVLRADVEALDCCICLEALEGGEGEQGAPAAGKKAVKTKCKHAFHSDCIREWLATHTTCPMCREELQNSTLSEIRVIDGVAPNVPLPSSVGEFLSQINPLFPSLYMSALSNAGFDTPQVLVGIRDSDLHALGVTGEDARLIMSAVQRLKGVDVPMLPAPGEKGGAMVEYDEHGHDDEIGFFEKEGEVVPKSTKLELLMEVLERISKEEPESKMLVFSQFTTFLDLIEDLVNRSSANLGSKHCRLGKTICFI